MKRRLKVLILFFFCTTSFLIPSLAIADSAVYFYDDVGRVVRVAAGNSGLIYQYDKVGNLLSITRNTISPGPPVLQRIDPNVLFIGSTALVSIKGQGLFTTRQVTSDNPFFSIRTLNITETEIRAEITVSEDAFPYRDTDVNINVTTGFGSAVIKAALTASELYFSPIQTILTPGSSGTLLASIIPSISRDVTITINNSNASVVSVPQSVTIPASGTATFTVTALNTGVSYIDTGVSQAVVYVTTDTFPSLPGTDITIMADPVSISIETLSSSDTTVSSLPVSIYIETPSSSEAAVSSLPVSIYIETPSSSSVTSISSPVSIIISEGQTPPQGDTTVASSPVSVYIETSTSGSVTAVSTPVSVYIETSLSASVTASSVPVSVYIETPSSTDATVISLPVSIRISQP